jgi:hypothetical protein
MQKIALILFLASPMLAHAYLGPGFGLGALATLLTLGSAAFFTVYSYVWLPIKHRLGLNKDKPDDNINTETENEIPDTSQASTKDSEKEKPL